jgi:hypothetical protein
MTDQAINNVKRYVEEPDVFIGFIILIPVLLRNVQQDV